MTEFLIVDPLSRRTPETTSVGPTSPYASFAYHLDEDDVDHMAYLESRVSRYDDQDLESRVLRYDDKLFFKSLYKYVQVNHNNTSGIGYNNCAMNMIYYNMCRC